MKVCTSHSRTLSPAQVVLASVTGWLAQLALLPAGGFAVGQQSSGIEPLLQSGLWSGGALPGTWKELDAQGNVLRKEWQPAGQVFGQLPSRVIATIEKGALNRMDVLFLDAGSGGDAGQFDQRYQQLAATLPAAIQAATGTAETVAPSLNGAQAQDWTMDAVKLRLLLEPGKRVWMTLTPVAGGTKTALATAGASAKNAKAAADPAANVVKEPDGDVIVNNLPQPTDIEGNRDITLYMALILEKYYVWPVSMEALARRLGWQPGGGPKFDFEKFLAAIPREANCRYETQIELDLDKVVRHINKGQPVIVWRDWWEIRGKYHAEFAKKLAADPQAELPPARDKEEQARWPHDTQTESEWMGSLIVGYNKKRGEVIFTDPGWGEDKKHNRMRIEELAATGYNFFFLLTVK